MPTKPKTAKKISRPARESCSLETLKGLQVSVADLTARERPEDPREAFATARQRHAHLPQTGQPWDQIATLRMGGQILLEGSIVRVAQQLLHLFRKDRMLDKRDHKYPYTV